MTANSRLSKGYQDDDWQIVENMRDELTKTTITHRVTCLGTAIFHMNLAKHALVGAGVDEYGLSDINDMLEESQATRRYYMVAESEERRG